MNHQRQSIEEKVVSMADMTSDRFKWLLVACSTLKVVYIAFDVVKSICRCDSNITDPHTCFRLKREKLSWVGFE